MSDEPEEFTEQIKTFGTRVQEEVLKTDMALHYPYGPKDEWSYWCTGDILLSEAHLHPSYANKTPEDLVADIYFHLGNIMNYFVVLQDGRGNDVWDPQKLIAFAYWNLITGVYGWTFEPLEGLSEEEKEKLYEIHEKRSELIYNHASGYDLTTQTGRDQYALTMEHMRDNRKRYGIYYVRHLPLKCRGKIHYTKQELCAIDTIIDCQFENCC